MASPTTIGTSASGNANSTGTKPIWVAGACPKGVSNHTSIASTSTTKHRAAGAAANGWGGASSQTPAVASMRAEPVNPPSTRSRADMRLASRSRLSASSACSSKLGSKDISPLLSSRAQTRVSNPGRTCIFLVQVSRNNSQGSAAEPKAPINRA
jgi:hypothetical protein